MTIYLYKDGADATEMRQANDLSTHYSNLTPMQYAFLASFLFHRQSVPLEICNDILTFAGFVMIIQKDTTAFLRGYSHMNYCYLESPIPAAELPQGVQVSSCCLCVVDISSHDQGWASSDTALNGTYEASYTWSELAIAETKDQKVVELTNRVCIGQNVRASHEFRHHRRALTPSAQASFLKSIKPGIWLRLYLLSQYPGWSNFANYGSIKVYLSLEATEEIPLQNLPNDQISLQSSSRCALQ
uniref:Uncharacterized protein AlNc14C14G1638 n=1 Tax=Albugo laibachii Nc14 TaxID=890382 RepID=F0W3R2_9STRA|nr:conserved hypothetical protein [Albugo laibachii Nc14]|eukprot:CCA15732.1 conserved hypothetical protein [Albugo laibachii Nc14]